MITALLQIGYLQRPTAEPTPKAYLPRNYP